MQLEWFMSYEKEVEISQQRSFWMTPYWFSENQNDSRDFTETTPVSLKNSCISDGTIYLREVGFCIQLIQRKLSK